MGWHARAIQLALFRLTCVGGSGSLPQMDSTGKPKNDSRTGGLTASRLIFYTGFGLLSAGAGFLAAGQIVGKGSPPPAPMAHEADAEAPTGKLIRHAEPRAVPDFAFTAADGTTHRLSEWRGKVVLLNLWATWCAPCKAEMPSLDRLQAKLGGDAFTVLAISLDRTGPDKPKAFFAGNGITHLTLYMSGTDGTAASLGASGLPLSVVLDRQGREAARLTGPAEWDSAATAAQIEELIKPSAD